MNPFLAQMYNTADNIATVSGATPEDFHKNAQAELLDTHLQKLGYDMSTLDANGLSAVATELFGPDNEITKMAHQAGAVAAPAPAVDSAQEKVAEADTLGRLMAHAYVDELANLEKKALSMGDVASKAKEVGGKVKDVASSAGGSIASAAREGASRAGEAAGALGSAAKGHKWDPNQTKSKALGAGLATAGVLGTAAAAKGVHGAIKKRQEGKEATASAVVQEIIAKTAAMRQGEVTWDDAVEKRAMEILHANGIDPSTGESVSDEEKIAAELNQRAVALLQSKGYQFEG